MEDEERIVKIEDRLDVVEEHLAIQDHRYDELRQKTDTLNEKQIRLDERVDAGFKRSEEQNNQIISSLASLHQNMRESDEADQKRYEDLLTKMAQGDRENSKEAAEGDRRNFEVIANRKWDARSVLITVGITAAVGIPSIIAAWQAIFK